MTLSEVNALPEGEFVAEFGALFEHSPWVAEAAARQRPFASLDDLDAAFAAAVLEAPAERKLALLGAHPELAGREAAVGELTDASAREQGRAGLDRLTAEELAALRRLNADYRERFGFPFIVCVREHTKESILAAGAARLAHPPGRERDIALREVVKIGRVRREGLVA
jgi:2-oxo-4-hydroxy-4-carboxy-5-ureidoimidazoline decarboxylase